MSYQWGSRSKQRIQTLDPRWVPVLDELIETSPFDLTVLYGFRNKEEQDAAYQSKNSTKKWPNSKHNKLPSPAVDIAPYHPSKPHIRWDDLKYFYVMAGMVIAIAARHGLKVVWGGNWDGDEVIVDDQKLKDLVHFEIVDG